MIKHDASAAKEAGTIEQKRKVFIAGQSLGGFVAAATCLKYGSLSDTALAVDQEFRPEISGGVRPPHLPVSAVRSI